jgi:phosphomannomutase
MSSNSVNPEIFKAYDIRATYPDQIDEAIARDIGRGFIAYLGATRIAVSRDMRISSPSLAAAFIEGATMQGADVVDYGLAGTDMLYYAVASGGFEGGAQITASHNPKQYNGVKLVRQGAFPLSGEAGISEIREMVTTGTLPAAAATRGTVTTAEMLDEYIEHVMAFIDRKSVV